MNLNPLNLYRWSRTVFALLDEARTGKSKTATAKRLVVAEIRSNARLIADLPSAVYWQSVKHHVRTAEWERHVQTLSILERRDPELVSDLVYAYSELTSSHSFEAPLSPDYLYALADRLEEAQIA